MTASKSTDGSIILDEIIPPRYEESEKYIISVLLRDEHVEDILTVLSQEHFYNSKLKSIFAAIKSMNSNIDPSTVHAFMNDQGYDITLHELLDLYNYAPSTANYPFHLQRIIDSWIRRDLQKKIYDHLIKINQNGKSGLDIIAEIENELVCLRRGYPEESKPEISSILPNVFDDISEKKFGNKSPGLLTEIFELDRIIGGFEPGEFVIVAARPSTGKSMLVKEIFRRVAQKTPCLLINLEGTKFDFGVRLLGALSNVDVMRIRKGALSDIEYQEVKKACNKAANLKIFVVDVGHRRNINDIVLTIKAMVRKHDIGLVAVDYIQLISVSGNKNSYERITEVSMELANLAKALSVPMIGVSQINRQSEIASRPFLHHLKGSGQLEQDADVVIILHKEDKVGNRLKIFVDKNRNGKLGSFELDVDFSTTKISDAVTF